MTEKPRIKVKFQETREEEVTYKQTEDLETIAEQIADAQSALSAIGAELETLGKYESLPECARKVLDSSRLSLGQDYLTGLLSCLVGQLYRDEMEEKRYPGDVTEYQVWKRGQFSPDPREREDRKVTKREVGPEKVEKVKRYVPIAGTGMRLLSDRMMQESRELLEKIKGLYQEGELTFKMDSGKKESVKEVGEDVMSFIKQYLRRLDEIGCLAKSSSLYERYRDKTIEEPKTEFPKGWKRGPCAF